MPIKKLPCYTVAAILQAARCDYLGFRAWEVETEGVGLNFVEQFRASFGKKLTEYEQEWIALVDGDAAELAEWAAHMQVVQARFDELDRQLAVKGTRLFNWDTVAECLGYLNAFRVAVEQVLDYNQPLPDEASA